MNHSTTRRDLLAAGATGLLILKPELVRGAQANSALSVGLIGCGRRGMAISTHFFAKNEFAKMTALCDIYDDQLAGASQKFSGAKTFKNYHDLLASDVDAVYIATPPYLHPEHFEAAVKARKHIFMEKPAGVDPAGCRRVVAAAKQADKTKRISVDYQQRYGKDYRRAYEIVSSGELGGIKMVRASWLGGGLPVREGVPANEEKIRNWLFYREHSGDIIVEQNIHAIDICNWVLQGHPVKATGYAGRKGREFPGDTCSSHFNIVYKYPNDVDVSFSSTQFGKVQFDVNERFNGVRGSSQSPYAGPLGIWGEEQWVWSGSDKPAAEGQFSASGSFSDNLAQADSEKQKAFIGSITSGKFHNQAAAGVETALTTMLGRQAAYQGRELTWDELLRSNEHWDSGIDLNKLG